MNVKQMVTVFNALMKGPASRLDLAERSGANPKAVGKMLNEMKVQKMIYVIDYSNETDGRNRVKLYAIGDGEDAQPRQSQSQEDRSRKSYAKRVQVKNNVVPMTTFVGGKSLWGTA